MLRPWIYMGVLLGSQIIAFIFVAIALILSNKFRYWINTPLGQVFLFILGLIAALLVVLFFLRPKSLSDFLDLLKIKSFQLINICFAVALGLFLGILAIFIAKSLPLGFSEKVWITRPFIHQTGPIKYLLTITLLIGPFFEEIIIRGFLYQAFRKTYGITFSILIISLIALLTHRSAMMTSIWVFLLLSLLQITLCVILEKTGNLLNCIACHFVYNATLAYVSLNI